MKNTIIQIRKFRFAILCCFLALTASSLMVIGDLKTDSSAYILPESHPSRVNLEHLKKAYRGSGEKIYLLYESNHTVYSHQSLSVLKELTEELEKISIINEADLKQLTLLANNSKDPELSRSLKELVSSPQQEDWTLDLRDIRDEFVALPSPSEQVKVLNKLITRGRPITKIESLANSSNIKGEDGFIDVGNFYKEPTDNLEELAHLRKDVQDNPLTRGALVTADDRSALLVLEIALDDNDTQGIDRLFNKINAVADEIVKGKGHFYVAGFPIAGTEIAKTIEQDTKNLLPIVFLIVFISLAILFRDLLGVFIPMIVVLGSLVCAWATMVFLGIAITPVLTALPVFILSIGIADGVHLYTVVKNSLRSSSANQAIIDSFAELFMPVILTSVTTSLTFLSLTLSEIALLQSFGLMVAIGTLYAMVFSLFLIPALLFVLPESLLRQSKEQTSIFDKKIDLVLQKITDFHQGSRTKMYIFIGFFVTISFIGASKSFIDNNPIDFFRDDNSLVKSTRMINHNGIGSTEINILISATGKEKEPFKRLDYLKVVDNLEDYLNKDPLVGKTYSLLGIVKRIHTVMNEDQLDLFLFAGDSFSKDKGKALVSQYLFIYGDGASSDVRKYVDSKFKELNVRVILRSNSSFALTNFKQNLQEYLNSNIPAHFELKYSGGGEVNIATTTEIFSSQIVSMFVSVGIILVILGFSFRNILLSFIGLIPLLMAVLMIFGILGWFSVPIDIGTVCIASVVFGIGIDFSIHYLSSLMRAKKKSASLKQATVSVTLHTGKAILSNALIVSIGFSSLLFSAFTPLVNLGWVTMVSLLVSAVCTVLLVPFVIHIFYEKVEEQV